MLLRGDKSGAQEMFEKCVKIAVQLQAVQMQLECLLCLAYISFDNQQWNSAKKYFDEAYFVSNNHPCLLSFANTFLLV